jgi:signal transduction histidine kinase
MAPAPSITIPWRTASFRLTALIASLFLIAALVIVAVLYWSMSDLILRQLVHDVTARAARVQARIARLGPDQAQSYITRVAEADRTTFFLLARSGDRHREAGNLDAWPSHIHADGKPDVFSFERGGERILALGIATNLGDGRMLLVARRAVAQEQLTRRLQWILLAGSLLIAGLGIGAGLVLSRTVLRRVDAISQTGERFLRGQMKERVPLTGSADELDALAGNLNDMFDRIEQLMRGMREVSDNIAHDLKTPLNRLRIRAEQALDTRMSDQDRQVALERIVTETDEIIRTFNALLQVAKLEAGAMEPVADAFDLSQLIADIIELYAPVAEEAGISLVCQVPPGIAIAAHRQLIGQAITNLIENALKYGRSHKASAAVADVRVSLTTNPREIIVSIADHGPGIAEPDRQRALERFVRLDESRSMPGTGLGLSLVAAVARGHGGEVRLLDNAPGLTAQLVLPRHLLRALATGPSAPETIEIA